MEEKSLSFTTLSLLLVLVVGGGGGGGGCGGGGGGGGGRKSMLISRLSSTPRTKRVLPVYVLFCGKRTVYFKG